MVRARPSLGFGRRRSGISLGNSIRFSSIDFGCPKDDGRALDRIDFGISPKRAIKVINEANSNGSALISLLIELCSPASKAVQLNKYSLESIGRQGLQGVTTLIRRGTLLFDKAVTSGLERNSRGTARRSVRQTVRVSRTGRFVSGCPSQFRRIIRRHSTGFSNKRRRHLSVTQNVVNGPGILVLSSSASTLSTRSRGGIRTNLRRGLNSTAMFVVTRGVFSIVRTSGVLIVSSKGVGTVNARRRLLLASPLCRGVCRARETKRNKV